MTLARITVSGKVTKNPEKRFTQNNLAITSFVMDIYPQDETLVRVLALGGLADRAAESIKMGDTVLVDGRLQTASVKSTNGKERKIIEINASGIEKVVFEESMGSAGYGQNAGQNMGYTGNSGAQNYNQPQAQKQSAPQPAQNNAPSDIVQFAVDEISEDLIDEDEIPF